MKRKRGHKKGKQKKHTALIGNELVLNAVGLNTEDNSGFDDVDGDQLDYGVEVKAPDSMELDHPVKPTSTDTDGFSDRSAGRSGRGRVKVKLRSSKMLESQHTSDAHTQSDTDKSSLQVGLEKEREVTEKMEDSANSFPEVQFALSGKSSRKTGSIKIKSSRGLRSSNVVLNQGNSPVYIQDEKTTQTVSDNDKIVESFKSRESPEGGQKLPFQQPQYKKKELNAALSVIKKVMKMDAAEPFNVPVNPIALGIPDYFDIIDTPMDFGTICSNLEQGIKYKNSEDVFKDVQFIWGNCHKYNNKGDYILDLMKRVKKNFTKYWTAAGLYTDQPKKSTVELGNPDASLDDPCSEGLYIEDDRGKDKAVEASGRKRYMIISQQENIGTPSLHESLQVENIASSSQEKMNVKGSHLKHKMRRRYGINHHKGDCLCAVCVVRRRRQEREGNGQMVENQTGVTDGDLSQEFKQEGASPVENPYSEDTSSNLENSAEPEADADIEEQGDEVKLETPEQQFSPQLEIQETSENEMEVQKKDELESSDLLQHGDGYGEEPNPHPLSQTIHSGARKNERSLQLKENASAIEQHVHDAQRKKVESQERQRRTRILEELTYLENPLILDLCGTLFSKDPRSVWSGPHSLSRCYKSVNSGRGIHEAVAMFMK
ncbi:PREDICTED: bromodomain-containing protein 3 isoform X2 [Nelumbo nucifera]|uniref:Bromo domain-containing protein n=2 Tax=Nelumbo nucifera TaxID=4432 RepID=A0A822ZI83_NELNU|nr:PREDICTED: bromodomain-containing protein 3 isoform X2 [Nelumbo nucifera]DAD43185.1 TPA_asm: hypothetical protein HUJ06_001415 [Nelumbo nucifera]